MDPEIAFRMKVTDAAAAAPLRRVYLYSTTAALVFPLFNDGSFNFNEQQHKNAFPTNDGPAGLRVNYVHTTTLHYGSTSKAALYKLFTN